MIKKNRPRLGVYLITLQSCLREQRGESPQRCRAFSSLESQQVQYQVQYQLT